MAAQAVRGDRQRQIGKAIKDPELRAQGHADRRDRLQADHAHRRLVSDADRAATSTSSPTGIAEVTPTGIRTTDGIEREADVLVLATGFHAHAFVAPLEITGAGRRSLRRRVVGRAAHAYLGMSVPGLPEPVPALRPEHQRRLGLGDRHDRGQRHHVIAALRALDRADARRIEVRREAAEAFDARAARGARGHGLALGLHQLVRRRARQRPEPVAVDLEPLPQAHRDARARRLRAGLSARPAVAQERQQHGRVLRAGGAHPAVDHEARHRIDAGRRSERLVEAHLLGEAPRRERLGDLVRGQAHLGGQPRQRRVVGEQLALAEVGGEQALGQRAVEVVRARELQQAVRVERAAAACDGEVEAQPLRRRGLGHAIVHGLRLLERDAVLARQVRVAIAGALGRRIRDELERAPRDLDRVAVLELSQRTLEAPLADEAPGAGEVRPDLQLHRISCSRRAWRASPAATAP